MSNPRKHTAELDRLREEWRDAAVAYCEAVGNNPGSLDGFHEQMIRGADYTMKKAAYLEAEARVGGAR